MIAAFLHGIGLGLVLTVMIGPVFFGLIQTSLTKGFRQACLYATGVSFSDITFILLSNFGVSVLFQQPGIEKMVNFAGGIVMILFGLFYLFKSTSSKTENNNVAKNRHSFFKGFLLNFLTPSVSLFWIGTVSIVSANYLHNAAGKFLFFLGIVITLFSCDIIKGYVAYQLKKWITQKIIALFNKIVGVVFVVAGGALLINIWRN